MLSFAKMCWWVEPHHEPYSKVPGSLPTTRNIHSTVTGLPSVDICWVLNCKIIQRWLQISNFVREKLYYMNYTELISYRYIKACKKVKNCTTEVLYLTGLIKKPIQTGLTCMSRKPRELFKTLREEDSWAGFKAWDSPGNTFMNEKWGYFSRNFFVGFEPSVWHSS